MKKTTLVAALALVLTCATVSQNAYAHEAKPQYGGIVAEGKAFDAELVAKADLIAIYVNDHGKPLPSKGIKAKLTMLNGSEKSEVELQPAGDNKLEAKGKFTVAKSTKIVAVVTPEGKSASTFRFEIK